MKTILFNSYNYKTFKIRKAKCHDSVSTVWTTLNFFYIMPIKYK